jgi:hypothetical protein
MVLLAGVLGVPWQDLATDPRASPLTYRRASTLDWDLFAPRVGQDYAVARARDPLMVESFTPREGVHPITEEVLSPPEAGYLANSINGHEWNTANRDVEYACIFGLPEPTSDLTLPAIRVCELETICGMDDGSDAWKVCQRRIDGCSCVSYGNSYAGSPWSNGNRPECQDSHGSYSTTQRFGKAYPSLRQLQVLRGFYETTQSDNAIVASACPKDLSANVDAPGYGYNPAMELLLSRVGEKLAPKCLARKLPVDPDGTIACRVIEAIPPSADQGWCNCAANQRLAVEAAAGNRVRGALESQGLCGVKPRPSCAEFCLCELQPLGDEPQAGAMCLNEPNVERTSPLPGFCYIDPAKGLGASELVSGCPADEANRQLLRIVGNGNGTRYQAAPAPGWVYLDCEE